MLPKNENLALRFARNVWRHCGEQEYFPVAPAPGNVFLLVSHEGAVMLSCNHASTQACTAAGTSSLPDPSMVRISHF